MSLRLSTRAYLVAGLVCLQAADLTCTYLLLDGGHRRDVYEANPLARSILETSGWLGLAAFKLAVSGVTLTACLALARRRPAVALRVLTALCVVMLGVNAYSGTLLVSPDASAVAERQANERSNWLEQKRNIRREFAQRRDAVCDAVLAGECDTTEATARLSGAIREYGSSLELPAAARLPDPSHGGQVLGYLSFHVRLRAEMRGLNDRLTSLSSLSPAPPDPTDPLTPAWMGQTVQ